MNGYRTYDYECSSCGKTTELTVLFDIRDGQVCDCGESLTRLVSAPAIHTLETHFRGYRGTDYDRKTGAGHFSPAAGSFIDENLCDRSTGRPLSYSSPREKERLLAEQGLYAKTGPRPERTKRRSDRRMIFTRQGSKRDQLG